MKKSPGERQGRGASRALVALGLVLVWGSSSALTQNSAETRPAAAAATQPAATWLRVAAERVNLRSRGDVNSVVVARVERGTVLRAVDRDPYGWYRILPPEGVFSLVSAEYIDRLSPTEGVASTRGGMLRVRVGSLVCAVDPLRGEVQALLKRGTSVRIIGEQDGWLKIVPPEGVYLHVSAQHTQPITDTEAARLLGARPATVTSGDETASSRPVADPSLSDVWGQRLAAVEEAIAVEGEKPLLEQAWAQMQGRLDPIAAQRDELQVARLAQAWIELLQQVVEDQTIAREAESILRRSDRERRLHEREMERIRRMRGRPASQPTSRPTRRTP